MSDLKLHLDVEINIDVNEFLDKLCDRCSGDECYGERHGGFQECWAAWNVRELIQELNDSEKVMEVN